MPRSGRYTKIRSAMLLVIGFSLAASTSFSQVPQKIRYQGFLTDSVTGAPISDDVEMIFSIYDVATAGTALWSETRTVAVEDGYYAILLGDTTPIDISELKPYWLGVQVGTEPELAPREELTSALYAMFAKYLEGITIKDGKVGIGTDDPQEMLDVHGNAHIRGVLHVGPNSIVIDGRPPANNGNNIITTTDNPGEKTITFELDTIDATGNFNAKGDIKSEGNITASGTIEAGTISTKGMDVNGKINAGTIETDGMNVEGLITAKGMDVKGPIKGNKMCIGDSCLDAWPDPCSCLPACENGQSLEYSGITKQWECVGEPIPLPPMKPLYRLYLGVGGSGWTNYLDSLSANEIGSCTGRLGYVLDSQISGTKPLYQKYRSHNGNGNDIKDDHLTTDNRNELSSEGWNYSQTYGYIYTTQVAGTIPLYLKYRDYWYNTWELGPYLHRDYITTTDKNEGSSAGWKYVRILGYIVGPASSSCR